MLALLGAAAPSPSPAPAGIAAARLDTMLRSGHADPKWFATAFLAQIPASQVDAAIASLAPSLGAYQSVEATANPNVFTAHFARGTDLVLIYIDADGKIEGLLFRPPILAASSLGEALGALSQRSGTVSYVVAEPGRSPLAAFNATIPLAVGSTFKLAVLNALLDEIRSGRRRWSDVVALRNEWKSLPSGVLQSWPAGTPITLATYAAEMISISDNTAADALAHVVGTAALAPYAKNNLPFLTTREAFILKSGEGAGLHGMYLTVDSSSGRAGVLARVDALPLPGAGELTSAADPAVEWHYTVTELCELMERVAALPLMSINPGVATPSDFAHVAYKGGSEPGVLNLTTMVTTKRGTRLCFSATVNDRVDIDETTFEAQYAAALRRLAEL